VWINRENIRPKPTKTDVLWTASMGQFYAWEVKLERAWRATSDFASQPLIPSPSMLEMALLSEAGHLRSNNFKSNHTMLAHLPLEPRIVLH
jgi:hypothetical protein